jgi:hypothetical protein
MDLYNHLHQSIQWPPPMAKFLSNSCQDKPILVGNLRVSLTGQKMSNFL